MVKIHTPSLVNMRLSLVLRVKSMDIIVSFQYGRMASFLAGYHNTLTPSRASRNGVAAAVSFQARIRFGVMLMHHACRHVDNAISQRRRRNQQYLAKRYSLPKRGRHGIFSLGMARMRNMKSNIMTIIGSRPPPPHASTGRLANS